MSSKEDMNVNPVRTISSFAVLFVAATALLMSGIQPAQEMGSAILVGLVMATLVIMGGIPPQAGDYLWGNLRPPAR